jgi:exopolysaccharide/PEP-CTERM locus tyrosine autokinase
MAKSQKLGIHDLQDTPDAGQGKGKSRFAAAGRCVPLSLRLYTSKQKKEDEGAMPVVCPACSARYTISGDNRDKIPEGTSARTLCKKCGGKIVIESSRVPEEIHKDILTTRIKYSQTKTIDVADHTLRDNRLVAFSDDSPIAEQYKILRTQILHKTREEGLNTLLVTSPGDNEGKSLTAANLAISLAKEVEHTVLLVDADLKEPCLHRLFGIKPAGGLADCLLNHTPLSDFLINPGINKLVILPGGHRVANSAEIVGSPAMKRLIHETKHRYQDRYIIFDAPPVTGSADTLILSQYVDGVILVVAYDKTPQEQIEKALELLETTNLLGTIMNKTPVPKK